MRSLILNCRVAKKNQEEIRNSVQPNNLTCQVRIYIIRQSKIFESKKLRINLGISVWYVLITAILLM